MSALDLDLIAAVAAPAADVQRQAAERRRQEQEEAARRQQELSEAVSTLLRAIARLRRGDAPEALASALDAADVPALPGPLRDGLGAIVEALRGPQDDVIDERVSAAVDAEREGVGARAAPHLDALEEALRELWVILSVPTGKRLRAAIRDLHTALGVDRAFEPGGHGREAKSKGAFGDVVEHLHAEGLALTVRHIVERRGGTPWREAILRSMEHAISSGAVAVRRKT